MEPGWDEEGMREWARQNASKGIWVSGSKQGLYKMIDRARAQERSAMTSSEHTEPDVGSKLYDNEEPKTKLGYKRPVTTLPGGLAITLEHVVMGAGALGIGILGGMWWKRRQRGKALAELRAQGKMPLPALREMPAWAY